MAKSLVQHGRRGGFSLIELLVVIFVIIVIVSITIPALSAGRKAARKAETQVTLSNLRSAVEVYENAERRPPGYFSPRQMGHRENRDRGFTSMQNVLLDLCGGIVPASTPVTGAVREVGPTNDPTTQVKINPENIGIATNGAKMYFTVNRKNLVEQDGTPGARASNTPEHQFPELVDAYGTPILAWVMDTATRKPLRNIGDFAAEFHEAGSEARFYWAQNSAFLMAGTRVGKLGVDNGDVSMLGSAVTAAERFRSLTGFLGNPSSASNISDASVTQTTLLPASPRGAFVFHSAGFDGAFLPRRVEGSIKDGGTGQCTPGASGGVLDFGLQLLGSDNKPLPASLDVVSKFNDIVVGTGS